MPYGQMSLWGATVITNLMSAIPWIGQDIVEFIWGGFSVNNATLNRFFALHFLLPFVLAALAIMHLISLHDSAGSGNPLGISANPDRLAFSPYYIFKDLITIFLFILLLSLFVFFTPNFLGDSENYVMANPMQTPAAIVPEWYLLPFYAILRSIPNKLLGVIAMFFAILILLLMPINDLSKSRGIQFKPLSKIVFFLFIGNFLMLMGLGGKHVESPYIELGLISTAIYFIYFLITLPIFSILENSLLDFNKKVDIVFKKNNKSNINLFNLNIYLFRLKKFYTNLISNKKIAIFLNTFYIFILFVFIYIILLIFTKCNIIDFPYGLIGVDFSLDDTEYDKLTWQEVNKLKEKCISDYLFHRLKLLRFSKKVRHYQKVCSIFHSYPGIPKKLRRNGMGHFLQPWEVWDAEYRAWKGSFDRILPKMNQIDKAIVKKISENPDQLNPRGILHRPF